MLSPIRNAAEDNAPRITLAHLEGLDLRRASDGWHGIWRADGAVHQFWLPEAEPSTAGVFAFNLPMDSYAEIRLHAARRFWRSIKRRPPGPPAGALPDQLREWNTLSVRALDAKLRGESYRTIAEVLLGFHGTKEDFESDPRKSRARRLVNHGLKMMQGGYRLLLHYPIKPGKRSSH